MQHSTPAAPAVRETLERLLASETFGRSERARKLLQYLVEREQAGEADKLKGFSIAMDVFGKDSDFDSSTDAVVRVQAGRLRDLLHQYFTGEGADDPLRIVIPRGTYIPSYELNAIRLPLLPVGTAGAEKAGAVQSPNGVNAASPLLVRHLQFFWMAMGLVIAMLGFLILRQSGLLPMAGAEPSAADQPMLTSSILPQMPDALPVVYLAGQAANPETSRVAASLRAGLSGFDTIDFIGRDFTETPDAVADATSFVFKVLPGPATGSVVIELQNVGSGRMLLSRILTAHEADPSRVEDNVAGILSATLSASGTIYGYIEQAGIQTGLTRCLLLGDDYYLDQNEQTHATAYRCFEKLMQQGAKSPLVYSELASLHLETITDHYAYPSGATEEQAMSFAHRAIQMGATSAYAYRSYGYLNSRLGNSEESIRWMRKAYQLNTYDLGMAAAYAYGLIFAGDYQQGTPIMARAVDASGAHPTWWDFGLFLGEFMLGNTDKAMRATAALTPTTAKSHYLAARLIAAKQTGDNAARTELLSELTTDFPKFAANPRKAFVDRKYPADLTDRLIEALHAAGLGSSS